MNFVLHPGLSSLNNGAGSGSSSHCPLAFAPSLLLGSLLVIAMGMLVRLPWLNQPSHSDQCYYTSWALRMRFGGLGAAYGKGGMYVDDHNASGERRHRLPPANVPAIPCILFHFLGNGVFPLLTGLPLDIPTSLEIHDGTTPRHQLLRSLFKVPAVLGDVIASLFLLIWVARRSGWRHGLAVALCYSCTPAAWWISARWGQFDSLPTMFMLLSIAGFAAKRLNEATYFWFVSLLIKWQAISLLPVVVGHWIGRDRVVRKDGSDTGLAGDIQGILRFALVTLILIWLPFVVTGASHHLFDPYIRTVGQYPYTTVQAFNGWWVIDSLTDGPARTTGFGQDDRYLLLAFGHWSGELIGLRLRHVGLLLVILGWIWLGRRLGKLRKPACHAADASVAATGLFFLFAPEMHERYLFPAIALFAIGYQPTMIWWFQWMTLHLCVALNVIAFFPTASDGMAMWLSTHRGPIGIGVAFAILAVVARAAYCLSRARSL